MPKIFKCPSCSAPIEFEGDSFQKCTFCQGNIMVPPEIYKSSQAEPISALDKELDKLADLVESGRKAEAIEFYKNLFNVGTTEATEAVSNISSKNLNIRTENLPPQTAQEIQTLISGANAPSIKINKKATAFLIAIPLIIVILTITIPLVIFFVSMNSAGSSTKENGEKDSIFDVFKPSADGDKSDSTGKTETAEEILKFGGKGIGAGNFEDNRDIGIDGDGRIYSADYMGNRIQVFDSEGKFLSQIKPAGKVQFRNLSVDREGNVYVLNSNEIHKYSGKSGKLLKKVGGVILWDLQTDLDGNIVAVDSNGNVMRYDKNLKRTAFYKNLANEAGMEKGFYEITVNGLDEIYMITTFKNDVFKFSKEGKFLDRFKVDGSMPQGIMVDGQNRIFVSDVSKILIYDGDGQFIDSFETNQAFGMNLNDKGELFVASRPYIYKYKLNL